MCFTERIRLAMKYKISQLKYIADKNFFELNDYIIKADSVYEAIQVYCNNKFILITKIENATKLIAYSQKEVLCVKVQQVTDSEFVEVETYAVKQIVPFTKYRRKAPCFSNGDIRRLSLLD